MIECQIFEKISEFRQLYSKLINFGRFSLSWKPCKRQKTLVRYFYLILTFSSDAITELEVSYRLLEHPEEASLDRASFKNSLQDYKTLSKKSQNLHNSSQISNNYYKFFPFPNHFDHVP